MPKTILDEATINDYAHYAKALMLHREVTVKSRDPHGVLEVTRPKFTSEHGGKMRILSNGGREYITLCSTEEDIVKAVGLPLRASNIDNYIRRLCAVNTSSRVDDTNPIRWELEAFYRYAKTTRPRGFLVTDDHDRVLKHITDYVETSKGGVVSIAEARKIVFRAMFEVGVLPEDNGELIDALVFGNYRKDIAALTYPKDAGSSDVSEKTNEHSGSSGGELLPIVIFLVVVLGVMLGLAYFLSH